MRDDRQARAKCVLRRAEAIYENTLMAFYFVFAGLIVVAVGSLAAGIIASLFGNQSAPDWSYPPMMFGLGGVAVTGAVAVVFHLVVKLWERQFHRWADRQAIDLTDWRDDA